MTVFFPNLSFEDELNERRSGPAAGQAMADLAPLMGLMAQPHDIVLLKPDRLPQAVPKCLCHASYQTVGEFSVIADCVVPWGWTNETTQFAMQSGMLPNQIPSLDSVRTVNSRQFSADFDTVNRHSPASLPFSERFGIICESFAEWESAVSKCADFGYDRWVAKPQFSHAGRNRLIVTGNNVNEQQLGWLTRQIERGGIYLEPWVQRDAEYGLQFEIESDELIGRNANGSRSSESIRFIGITRLINDQMGRYAGSLIRSGLEHSDACAKSIEHGYRICQAAQKAGYFGPLGIDSFQFRGTDGEPITRLCNDINARFTMGRLALSLKMLVPPKCCGLWCQITFPNENDAGFADLATRLKTELAIESGSDVRIICTSPEKIGNRPVRTATFLSTAQSERQLIEIFQTLNRRNQ